MEQKFGININLTKLFEFSKANPQLKYTLKNGEVVINASAFINDKKDPYGNSGSLTLYDKEKREACYIGNFREFEKKKENIEEPKKEENNDPF